MRPWSVPRFQRVLALLLVLFVNLSQPAFGMRVEDPREAGLEEELTVALRGPTLPAGLLKQLPAAEGPAGGVELPASQPGEVRPELGGIEIGPNGEVKVPKLPDRPVSLGTEILLTAVAPLEALSRMTPQIPTSARQRQPLYVLDSEAIAAAPALARMEIPFVVIARTPAVAEALRRDLSVPADRIIGGLDAEIVKNPNAIIVNDVKTLRILLKAHGFDLPALQPLLEVYDHAVQAATDYLQAMV